MKNLEIKRIDNKVRSRYLKLLKQGYYLKPEVYKNTTIVSLCKDIHCKSLLNTRLSYGNVSISTAQKLSEVFGFKIKNKTEYFGSAEPIPDGMLKQYTYKDQVINLLN